MSKNSKLPSERRKNSVWEKTGDILINLGQIIFGTIFLGSVLERKLPQNFMLIGGFAVAVSCFIIGLVLYAKSQKGKE